MPIIDAVDARVIDRSISIRELRRSRVLPTNSGALIPSLNCIVDVEDAGGFGIHLNLNHATVVYNPSVLDDKFVHLSTINF